MNNFNQIKEKIKFQINIVNLISENHEVKKVGSHYTCKCWAHEDNKPSMVIYEKTNSYWCPVCGESGDIFGYVQQQYGMSFWEALRFLAGKCGIHVDDKDLAKEDKEAIEKIEAMKVVTAKCHEYFKAILQGNPQSEGIKYALSRWNEDTINSVELGFVPQSADFMNFVRYKGLSVEILKELGIVKDGQYGLFAPMQGRIVFPIKDWYGYVIAFIARSLAPDTKNCKYINSPDSPLFKKGDALFGISDARSEAASTGKMYLVEGCPDVLSVAKLGFKNVVAPLGTAVTESQLSLIKRAKATKIIIIPDKDDPKGKEYGPGIASAIRTAQLALEAGFVVLIKEIPDQFDENNNYIKADPGSYFTSKEVFEGVKETDFITWYAYKKFEGIDRDDITGMHETLEEVCSFVAMLPKNKQGAYHKPLKSITGYNIPEIKELCDKSFKERCSKEKEQKESRETQYFGLFTRNNSYYRNYTCDEDELVSNFVVTPLYHVIGDEDSLRILELANNYGQKTIITLRGTEFFGNTWRAATEKEGNFIWMGSEHDLGNLKRIIYQGVPVAYTMKQLGWKDNVFVFSNGILTPDKFYEANEYGIVTPEGDKGFYIPSADSRANDLNKRPPYQRYFEYHDNDEITLVQYFAHIIKMFGENGVIGVCFAVSCFFRSIVMRDAGFFPLLFLFGPKTTGKSQLAITLSALCMRKAYMPNLNTSTKSALGDYIGSSSNAIIPLDEYKTAFADKYTEMLKGTWDGTGSTKKGGNNYKNTLTTSVDSGIIVTGQDNPTSDDALFSRTCKLEFFRSEYKSKQDVLNREILHEMLKSGVTHLVKDIVFHHDTVNNDFASVYSELSNRMGKALEGHTINQRIFGNWVAILSVVMCLKPVLELPLNYDELFDLFKKRIIKQNEEINTVSDLAKFFKAVKFLLTQGSIHADSDYRFQITDRLGTNKKPFAENPRKILLLNPDRVFDLAVEHCRRTGVKIPDQESLIAYLLNHPACRGRKRHRFSTIPIGFQIPLEANGNKNAISNSIALDYELIKTEFDISLDPEEECYAED